MKIDIKQSVNSSQKMDALVIPVYEDDKKGKKSVGTINVGLQKQISKLKAAGIISGKPGDIVVLYDGYSVKAGSIVCVGMGKESELNYDILRKSMGDVGRKLKAQKAQKILIALADCIPFLKDDSYSIQAVIEGLIMGQYAYEKYKTKEDTKGNVGIEHVELTGIKATSIKKANEGAQRGVIFGEAVNMARDLANTPSNHLTPKMFVEYAKANLDKKLKLEIIDKKKAEALGMQAFLGVAKGSSEDPYILTVKYLPKKAEKPFFIVGKGVTFDSGGISIKPSQNMEDMKGDMSGAAAVFSVINAFSHLKIERNVCAIIPLVENMPSGNAQKPGDVIRAMNGKTVEIINTDAEGRLILADALCYAVKQKPQGIIDIATLTGACSVALGDVAAGILGNNSAMIKKLLSVSNDTGDKLWELPLYDEYLEYLKSDIADIRNCSDKRLAGTANAAKFLEQFVADVPWTHIDIAGVMDASSEKGYTVKGMSGRGVRNILEYLCRY